MNPHPSSPSTEGKVLAPLLPVTDEHLMPAHRGGFEQSTDTSQGNPKQETQVKAHMRLLTSVSFLVFTALFSLQVQKLSTTAGKTSTCSPALLVLKTPSKPHPKHEQGRITPVCASRACWWWQHSHSSITTRLAQPVQPPQKHQSSARTHKNRTCSHSDTNWG